MSDELNIESRTNGRPGPAGVPVADLRPPSERPEIRSDTESTSSSALRRRAELEPVIKNHAFKQRGLALAEILKDQLYLPDFNSFEDYCVQRFGFKRAHGYRLIDAAEVAVEMSPFGDIEKESHARALLEVAQEQRPSVFKQALLRAASENRRIKASDILPPRETKQSPSKSTIVTRMCTLWSRATEAQRQEFATIVDAPIRSNRGGPDSCGENGKKRKVGIHSSKKTSHPGAIAGMDNQRTFEFGDEQIPGGAMST